MPGVTLARELRPHCWPVPGTSELLYCGPSDSFPSIHDPVKHFQNVLGCVMCLGHAWGLQKVYLEACPMDLESALDVWSLLI